MSHFGQSAHMYITSKDRPVNQPSHKFDLYLSPAINEPKAVSVVTCEIPNTWYPFDSFNRYLSFKLADTDTVYVAEMPTDRYYLNPMQLADSVQSAMNSAQPDSSNPGGFTCSFVESKLSLTFGHSSGEIEFLPVNNSAYSMLGLSQFPWGNSFSSYTGHTINLQKTEAIYVVSNLVPSSSSFSTFLGGDRILAKLSVTGNAGEIVTYQDSTDENTIPLDHSEVSVMCLTLLDDRGHLLDLNGRDWSLELALKF